MKRIVKEAVDAELKFIDEMAYGETNTTAFILGQLGYKDLDFLDLLEIDHKASLIAEKTRDYILDKSAYDNLDVGLSFNLFFVKKRKK